MARDYFIQTTSLVPPRGVRVEMTEIRPLRPNQAVILPGVAVLGQGLKFEVNIFAVGRLGLPFFLSFFEGEISITICGTPLHIRKLAITVFEINFVSQYYNCVLRYYNTVDYNGKIIACHFFA